MVSDSATDAHLPERLARAITLAGPIPLSQFMGAANAHYYATRDPLGQNGDFTTAPEVSQMFGELIGLCLADMWDRAGRPSARYVEFGPGRGTLAVDALRAMRRVGLEPSIHFIETSPRLRAEQAQRVPDAEWHIDLVGVPDDGVLLVVANEFFDALPIRQLVRTAEGWRERLVACQDTLFLPVTGKHGFDAVIPPALRNAEPGSILETSPAAVAVMRQIDRRLHAQGGAALIVDYGYVGPAIGDTFQAVRDHRFVNPFDNPGEQDLTAHVDFGTLAEAARDDGLNVAGPIGQGAFLEALGIGPRAAALARSAPDRAEEITAARDRLTHPQAMGSLFKAMAVTAPRWPAPAGFE